MKSLTTALIGAATAAAAVIESRQSDTNAMLSGLALMAPAIEGVVRSAKSQLRKEATRQVIRYGPFGLLAAKNTSGPAAGHAHGGSSESPAAGGAMGSALGGLAGLAKPMDPNGIGVLKRLKTGVCKNCTVLTGEINVLFENGSPAGVNVSLLFLLLG